MNSETKHLLKLNYETLLLTCELYEWQDGLNYQRLSLKRLKDYLATWKPNQPENVALMIEILMKELYCNTREEREILSIYEAFLRSWKVETGHDWCCVEQEVDLFLAENQSLKEWDFFSFYLLANLKDRTTPLLSDESCEVLFKELDYYLADLLKKPLMLKRQLNKQVYQKNKRTLISIGFTEASVAEVGSLMEECPVGAVMRGESLTASELFLSQLILNLTYLPRQKKLPIWDYETVLDLLKDYFDDWVDIFRLHQDQLSTEEAEEEIREIWLAYWNYCDLKKMISMREQRVCCP